MSLFAELLTACKIWFLITGWRLLYGTIYFWLLRKTMDKALILSKRQKEVEGEGGLRTWVNGK